MEARRGIPAAGFFVLGPGSIEVDAEGRNESALPWRCPPAAAELSTSRPACGGARREVSVVAGSSGGPRIDRMPSRIRGFLDAGDVNRHTKERGADRNRRSPRAWNGEMPRRVGPRVFARCAWRSARWTPVPERGGNGKGNAGAFPSYDLDLVVGIRQNTKNAATPAK